MNGWEFLEKMDLIEDGLLMEAAEMKAAEPKNPRMRRILWIGSVAAAAVVLLSVCLFTLSGRRSDMADRTWPTRQAMEEMAGGGAIEEDGGMSGVTAEGAAETVAETHNDLAVEIPWDEQPVLMQYGEFEWDGKYFRAEGTEIAEDLIGGRLGELTVKGLDSRTGERHETQAEIFAVKDISPEYVCVIRYAGDETNYCCFAGGTIPASLGEFVESLQFGQYLQVSDSIDYSYYDRENGYHRVVFEGFTKERLLAFLAEHADAPSAEFESLPYSRSMSAGVQLEYFQSRSWAIWLYEEGYIATNLLDWGKAFYIGEDAVRAFEEEIFDTLDGYEEDYRPNVPMEPATTSEGFEVTEETTAE